MKAQLVKNAVIVPTGAKGGFYPKQLPPSTNRDAWLAEGTETYRIFIRSLLSITDNLVNDKVVHPEKVVIHDGDDPYFVVAADKGTATFSDVANAIALERNFWLGDAFASGGSHGYDHKAMGITAKGAWISVQRHFLEMGIDVQSDLVSVAGCGDASATSAATCTSSATSCTIWSSSACVATPSSSSVRGKRVSGSRSASARRSAGGRYWTSSSDSEWL